jgi:actin-related protein
LLQLNDSLGFFANFETNLLYHIEYIINDNKKMSSAPIIVDIGTTRARIGKSGEVKPNYDQLIIRNEFVQTPPITCPVWDSSIYSFDHYEQILNKSSVFADGSSTSTTSSNLTDVLIVESTSEKDLLHSRSKICEIFLEKKSSTISGLAFQFAPVLSCFSHARQTGLVLDMSGGGCTASAVLDGWCLLQTNVERSELGGEDLDSWLSGVDNGPVVTKDAFLKLDAQRKKRETPNFTLPDGTELSTKVCDALFDPSPLGSPATYVALHELVFTAATKQTSNEIRRSLLNNVVICGGLACTDGINQRLTNELGNMARMDHPRVISCGPAHRPLSSWIGGSILTSLPIFKELCVTKPEYDEMGIQAIMKKCA